MLHFLLSTFAFLLPMVPILSNSGVPQDHVEELVRTYRAAQERLKAIVLNPPGGTAKAATFNQARAATQLAQIERILAALKQEAATWVGQAIPQAFADGIARADTQAREAGVSPADSAFKGSFSLVDHGTIDVFARDTYHDLAKAAGSMADRAKRMLRATRQEGLSETDINRILAGGVIEGMPAETIRTLREELRKVHGNEVQVIDKNGSPINFEVGYYASMVARTKTREATVKSRHGRLQKLGLDLVEIIGRVSKNFCTAYLGQVFSLSGTSGKYQAYASLPGGGPPFHPNCTKSTRPFVESLASEKELDDAEGDDDQEKMLNIDQSTAQRRFKDLQLHQQVKERYANTAAKLFP
jgi:Phage minor capsid protein 2